MAADMQAILIPELVSFATVDGSPAAMCVALPDLNEMIRGLNGRLCRDVRFITPANESSDE